MTTAPPPKPRVFVDADALFTGAAAPTEYGASQVVLRMAEITLIDAVTSQQVIVEVERNLADKLPAALPAFQVIVQRCLRVVPDPEPADLAAYVGLADPKDLPILVAAAREGCQWLVTFNVRHFHPGHPSVTILRLGDFILRIRHLLAHLTSASGV